MCTARCPRMSLPAAWCALALLAAAAAPAPVAAQEQATLQQIIADQLSAGKNHLVIPPGQYRTAPHMGQHLLLANLTDVVIDARGVELICTETTRAVTIVNCTNLLLRGLSIDYDPLPFTQGVITAMSDDNLVHDIRLFDGYPRTAQIKAWKYEIFRPDTRTLRFGDYYDVTAEALTPDTLRVTKAAHYADHRAPEQVGDIIVIAHAHLPTTAWEQPHAVSIASSSHVTLQDVTVYASNMFGFLDERSTATAYERCVVARRPAETDLVQREDARIRSLNADAFHSKFAPVGPTYRDCQAHFMGDDAIAINGDYHMVMTASGRELRVVAKDRWPDNWPSFSIRPGERVELLTYDGRRLPAATVTAVARDQPLSAAERGFVRSLPLDAQIKRTLAEGRTGVFRVTLDREVQLPAGSVIAAAGRMGHGFSITGGRFGYNRSRALAIKASDGVIRNNHFEGSGHDAVRITSEYWWLEAGSSDNLVIADNTFAHNVAHSIAVLARGARGQVVTTGVAHHRITITGNRFADTFQPAIRIEATADLILRDNSFPDAIEPSEAISLINTTLATDP